MADRRRGRPAGARDSYQRTRRRTAEPSRSVACRLSVSEYALLEQAAERAGVGVGTYVAQTLRKVIFGG